MKPRTRGEVRQHLDGMDMPYGVADLEADPLEHEWLGLCEECGEEMAGIRCTCMDPNRAAMET